MTSKLLFVTLYILTFYIGFAQEPLEIELDSIKTESDAFQFIDHHKSVKSKLITFNREKHHSKLADDLFELGNGGKKTYDSEIEKTIYKLVDRKGVLHHRVSYILLDGNKKSMQEINTLRNIIISKYNEGTPFEELAKKYSMDINGRRGGDSGWFAQGEMLPEFEKEVVLGHNSTGSIIKIDIPSKKWYYVVLKTYDNKMIDEIKVLKSVESITR